MAVVPVPHAWTAGDDATSANLQTLTDAILFLLGSATSTGARKPFWRLRQTVAQSVANNAFASITFDTEDVDYDNGHSTVTNTSRYTAQTAGWHDALGGFVITGNATGNRYTQFAVNGTARPATEEGMAATGAATATYETADSVYLNAGDYLEVQGFQNSGGALNTVASGSTQSMLAGKWTSN